MAKLDLSRWFGAKLEITPPQQRVAHDGKRDAEVRETFGLSRWFAGIGKASDEERLRAHSPASNASVRAAVDRLPVTLFEFDADGIYTCAAGRYINLFGISTAQIVGRSVFEFPRLVPGKNMMVRRALAGETVSFTGFWPLGRYAIRLQPVFDAEGRVRSVVGLGHELSRPSDADQEVAHLLEALRQSETRFRAMCESAPLGIYVCNAKLELGYVNPALCTLIGCSADELLGRAWPAALYANEPELQQATRVDGLLQASFPDRPLRMQRKDGAGLWTSLRVAEMRDGPEVLGYMGAITDITQERAARLAIDRVQQDLRRVIETSPEGIALMRDGRFIFVNPAMVEALGYARPEQLVGQNASAIVHPDDRPLALELSGESHPSWEDGSAHELRYRKADGEYALMEIRPAELGEFEGAPAVLITARDITERKKLQAHLQVTERLLSVATLAAGVAHEINNPLAVVMSNLEWVTEQLVRMGAPSGGKPDAAVQRALARIERPVAEAREAAARVRAIVGDLKLFSRAEEERAVAVDLTRVLDSAARMAWNEVRHRARFVREYGELPPVQGSEARLGQVFLNLIINAAQAIPEGHVDNHEIRLCARALPSKQVLVEVRDTGSGIPEALIGRIFDPFFTTKPPGIGTGLGLAICHRIVTSLGGRIDVESRLRRGTVFRVTLEAADPAAPVEPAIRSVPPPRSESRGRVLVIDDDPALGNAIGLLLGEDHEVEVLTSARQALRRLREGESFDAIVCDVMMPEMSGVDFHSELATTLPELATQIIFMSGGAFTLHAREFLDSVKNPRLEKPFDTEYLRAIVNRQVARTLA